MAGVEAILEVAASIGSGAGRSLEALPIATHALWICACVTSSGDAPIWLIYDSGEDRIAWRRVPDGVAPRDLVDARLSAGGHADPAEVLRWLERKAPDPWAGGGAGWGDAAAMEELRRRLRRP